MRSAPTVMPTDCSSSCDRSGRSDSPSSLLASADAYLLGQQQPDRHGLDSSSSYIRFLKCPQDSQELVYSCDHATGLHGSTLLNTRQPRIRWVRPSQGRP
jgi:hypothetical protein